MEENFPQKIGKYEILSVLGRGGMGVVYRALDPDIGRQVAIKTITEDFTRDPAMLRRFQSEAEKTGMLMHPNIVIVYHLGSMDGYPYIVMEYIEGDPLDRLIKTNHPLPLIYKLKIIEQVCAALAYAHDRDMIHRDVKPANVIVQPDGNAKLLDFGIARQEKRDRNLGLTVTGSVIGTVPYMAPERLKGAPLDGRSDIFAAGVLLYQFLTGRLPFDGEEMVLVQKLLNERHPLLSSYMQDYPPQLDAVIDRALAKEPDQRYGTADEMAADLSAVIHSLTTEQVDAMMVEAEHLSSAGDQVTARKLLLQILKLDSKNRRARSLLGEVQEHLSRKHRSAQAEACLAQARQAIGGSNFGEAISLLEQAERLVPGDAAVADLMESARSSKRLQEQIDGYLRQADAARSAGNYSTAQTIVEKALQLDTGNSRLRTVYADLARQAEESLRRARLRSLLDAAQGKVQLRQFREAASDLKNAEEIDPLHFELVALRKAVETGIREEQRRRVVEEVERQVNGVSTAEDAERVAAVVARALDTMPYDSALLRLQVELQRQQREHQEQSLLDETMREYRAKLDAEPQEALAAVRRALAKLPGNDHLLGLEASIEAHIANLARDARQAGYLSDARDAMTRRDFAAAIPLLAASQEEGHSDDTARMLEFAREELAAQRRNELFARYAPQVQAALRAAEYQTVIQLLEPALFTQEEPRLRAMLDQAQTLLQEAQRKSDASFAALQVILEGEDYERALYFVEALPQPVREEARFRSMDKQLRQDAENEWTQLLFLGESYAAMTEKGRPLTARERRRRLLLCKQSALLTQMFQAFEK